MIFKAGILCMSDKGAAGEREDKSSSVIRDILEKSGIQVVQQRIIRDDMELIEENLIEMSDERNLHLILTTGGTGLSPRDNTPEATKKVIKREVPGISEGMRSYSMAITKRAMLSRGVSGIRGNTLIINLPGSPKAVQECLEFITEVLDHGLKLINLGSQECGAQNG